MTLPHGFILCLLCKLRLVLILSQASHHLFVCHHIFVCASRNYIVISSTIHFEINSSFVSRKKRTMNFYRLLWAFTKRIETAVCLWLTIRALFSCFCSWTGSYFDLCYFCRRSYGLCKMFALFTWRDIPQPDALVLWLPPYLVCLLLLSLQFIYPCIQPFWLCIHFVSGISQFFNYLQALWFPVPFH